MHTRTAPHSRRTYWSDVIISRLKNVILAALPAGMREPTRNLYRRIRWGGLSNQEVFERIYRDGLWGEHSASPFSSGDGSIDTVTQPYVDTIAPLLQRCGITSIVDLGCGDFRVGRLITSALPEVDYLGIDIVRPLIEYNIAHYATPRIRFSLLDITRDELPRADACLVRQVFQHLSNAQIASVLARMRATYRCIAITETHPMQLTERPNMDKPPGPSVRHQGHVGGGIYLDQPPYELPVRVVLEVVKKDEHFPERLTTYWLEPEATAH